MAPGCIAVGRSVSQHLRNSSCWHLREYNEPVWFARRYRMSPSTEKTALVFITKFISVFIYRKSKSHGARPTINLRMTRLAIYLRPVRGEPCRCARGRSAYLFVRWPRAAAIARRQHDEFVVRPCDAKDFSILDTHSTRHGTLKPYLSTMFIRDHINRLVASFLSSPIIRQATGDTPFLLIYY